MLHQPLPTWCPPEVLVYNSHQPQPACTTGVMEGCLTYTAGLSLVLSIGQHSQQIATTARLFNLRGERGRCSWSSMLKWKRLKTSLSIYICINSLQSALLLFSLGSALQHLLPLFRFVRTRTKALDASEDTLSLPDHKEELKSDGLVPQAAGQSLKTYK